MRENFCKMKRRGDCKDRVQTDSLGKNNVQSEIRFYSTLPCTSWTAFAQSRLLLYRSNPETARMWVNSQRAVRFYPWMARMWTSSHAPRHALRELRSLSHGCRRIDAEASTSLCEQVPNGRLTFCICMARSLRENLALDTWQCWQQVLYYQ